MTQNLLDQISSVERGIAISSRPSHNIGSETNQGLKWALVLFDIAKLNCRELPVRLTFLQHERATYWTRDTTLGLGIPY
jgi:hypothetical protein